MELSARKYFDREREEFFGTLDASIEVSRLTGGKRADEWKSWSTWLFMRQCLTGQSVRLLVDAHAIDDYTLDCGAIGTLARNLIETAILVFYLTEENSTAEQKLFRKHVWDLHDCIRRKQIFEGLQQMELSDGFAKLVPDLRDKIENDPPFKELSPQVKKDILKGQRIFVDGLYATAAKAGWDETLFRAVYKYLSQQVHSAPMSFYRTPDDRIDFVNPTDFQFGFTAFALEHSRISIGTCGAVLLELFPEIEEQLPDGFLETIKKYAGD